MKLLQFVGFSTFRGCSFFEVKNDSIVEIEVFGDKKAPDEGQKVGEGPGMGY